MRDRNLSPVPFLQKSDSRIQAHGGSLARPQRLGDEVYEAILGQLMSLKIQPGAHINVDNLVREFGVSQTPIREALGRLEADGLVIKTQFIGYSASPQLTKTQFDELYELRLLLEPYAASKAAASIDDLTAASLQQFANNMAKPVSGDADAAYGQFARQDAEFHDRIAVASRHDLIRDTLSRLHTHVHLFRLLFHSRVTHEAIDEHVDIVRALAARDPDAASTAMRRHIERSRDRFVAIFD